MMSIEIGKKENKNGSYITSVYYGLQQRRIKGRRRKSIKVEIKGKGNSRELFTHH